MAQTLRGEGLEAVALEGGIAAWRDLYPVTEPQAEAQAAL